MSAPRRIGTVAVCGTILALLFGGTSRADAALVYFTNSFVLDFVPDTATPDFLAAIGGAPDEFLSFSADRFGNPAPDGLISGAAFSTNVVFATLASSFGPASSDVRATGSGVDSEIGPAPEFDGILSIDFLAAGRAATAVGFGLVSFESEGFIRIFDSNGVLLDTQPGVGGFTGFTFFGVVATGPELIGRIELDAAFFAIQDIQFTLAATVPEPSTRALLGLGSLALAGCWRRRAR